MADKSYKLTLSLSNGTTLDAGTITAPQGPTGANGVTFTPSVSAVGVLSWTNDGGLTNPSPINIKGPKGDDAVITESDVAGWGFTKNTGTVTSVSVKMNGATKGTVTSSGTIDLGTVLTSHQDISGKANLSGGNTFTGKQTLNSPASDGYSINAAGYIKGSWLQSGAKSNYGSGTGMVCVFDGNGWIYYRTPSEILTEAGGANLSGGNTFTGQQIFNNTVGGVTNQLVLNETQWDIFTCRDLTSPTTKTAVGKGFVWCQDSDAIYSQFKSTGIYYGNDTSGYEGTLKFPTNISGEKTIATTDQIPTYSLSGTTLTITLP